MHVIMKLNHSVFLFVCYSTSYSPLRCEIFFFADLHEFWSKPVSLEGQGALGRLYRV